MRFVWTFTASLVFYERLKSIKTIVAMVLLVLWVPATSLCLVERAGWLANDDCCPSTTKEAPTSPANESSPCCWLASGSYKSNDDTPVLIQAQFTPLVIAFTLNSFADPSRDFILPSELPPPELAVGWQFSFRTALSPRAPSFVS
jgi:hypothetical protein